MGALVGLFLRHVLTGAGAVLVSRGLDPTSAETLVGAATVLGGLAWSWLQKKKSGAL